MIKYNTAMISVNHVRQIAQWLKRKSKPKILIINRQISSLICNVKPIKFPVQFLQKCDLYFTFNFITLDSHNYYETYVPRFFIISRNDHKMK